MATTPQGYEPLSPDANGSTPAKSPISAYALELLRRGGDWCGGARRRERRPRCAAKPAEFGSLNYDIFESDVSARESERWRPKKKTILGYSGRTFWRWVLTALLGVAMGCVAVALSTLTDAIIRFRRKHFGASTSAANLVACVAFDAFLAVLAAGATAAWAPGAAGSGIPVVKAYLNGVRLRGCLSLRVFAVKFLGTALAVGSGASLGPEGPLVHLGAVAGSMLTGGVDRKRYARRFQRSVAALRAATSPSSSAADGQDGEAGPETARDLYATRNGPADAPPPYFHSDVDRRDFLSLGAACGFSAAFGAPIGGVLFALEEAASYWDDRLLWRGLVAAALATFTGLALEHGVVGLSKLSHYGLISLSGADPSVHVGILLLAAPLGCAGGVAGAGFNAGWTRLMRLRDALAKRLPAHQHKASVVEAAVVVAMTSILFLWVAVSASHDWACVVPNEGDGPGDWGADTDFAVQFGCPDGKVHEVASLWFGARELAIKKILEGGSFSGKALFACGSLSFATLLLVFGNALPGGLFLPLIYSGACLGGATTRSSFIKGTRFEESARRHMALLGAVALLAGVQRTTVSLVVIVLEGTGNMHMLLPIIVTTVFARGVGNLLGEGLYEVALDLKKVPFLEKHVPRGLDGVRVSSLLEGKPPPMCLPRTIAPAVAAATLRRAAHGAFPVVDDAGALAGLALREHVRALLQHRGFADGVDGRLTQRLSRANFDAGTSAGCSPLRPGRASTSSDAPQQNDALFRMSDDLRGSADGAESFLGSGDELLDVEPIMVRSPHVVYADCPVSRAYRIFATLALRHLVVIEHADNTVAGVLTRADFRKLVAERHHTAPCLSIDQQCSFA